MNKLWIGLVSVFLIAGLVMSNVPLQTVQAQELEDFKVSVEFDGVIQAIQNDQIIFTDGTVVNVPNLSLLPSTITVGTEVTVVATIDGDTLNLTFITLKQQETPQPTLFFTPMPTMQMTAEPTMEPTAIATLPADCPQPPGGHPVAQRLANAFGVSYEEIMGWKCAGYGFGEITKAYALAQDSGKSAADIFAMRAAGMGWGKIIKELGLKPGDYGNGKIVKEKDGKDKADKGKGNKKDKKDKGNNGKGNGGNNGNNGKGNKNK